MADRVTILTPTGHLGFTPIEADSFRRGLELRADYLVADSGSCDIGPHPLGADEPCSPAAWQRHDLELMLLAARRLGVPMIVGSASDTGTDRGVAPVPAPLRAPDPPTGLAADRSRTPRGRLGAGPLASRRL